MPERDGIDLIIEQWQRERPDLDSSPIGIVGRVSRLAREIEERLEPVYREHGLEPGWHDLLATLRRRAAGPCADRPHERVDAHLERDDEAAGQARGGGPDRPHPRPGRPARHADQPHGRRTALIDEPTPAHLANERRHPGRAQRGRPAAARRPAAQAPARPAGGVRAPGRRLWSSDRDRPRRAAHHDPPPVGPVRLPAARRAGRRRARSCASRSGARRSTASSSRWPTPPRCPPRSSSRRPPCARSRSRATSWSWRCGWPREYCSTPARALSLVLPPPRARRARELWAERTAAELDGERLTASQRGAAGAAARPGRAPTWRAPAAARGARARRDRARGRSAGRRAPNAARRTARVELTPEQARGARARARAGGAHLLHGVTGSGKTEVYLRAAAEALERGRGVIVLVPEIALTPQTVARFQARFGDTVALLHSALGEGERYDEWRRLRTGEARIAVGPRSAVFAPVARPRPGRDRRGARRLLQARGRPALRRPARRRRARPPRRRGAARRLGDAAAGDLAARCRTSRCPSRVDGRPLPPVEVLDMRGAQHPLHPLDARARCRRRASRSCCSTAAAGRTSSPAARAGRCGSARSATSRSCCTAPRARSPATTAATASACPSRCDACGSLAVARHGAGTERIEAELREALDVPVFRLDADTAGDQGRRARAARRASTPRPPASCSAPRWSPRATTSRT